MLPRLDSLGRELAGGLLHVLYPAICHACGCSLTTSAADFCNVCRQTLITDPHPACPRCAGTVGPYTHLDDGCPRCRNEGLRFARAWRLGPYDGLLRELILRMKLASGDVLAETVGILWAEHMAPRLRDEKIDVVVPVPLHWWRRFGRGHNQSEALARALSDRLGVPSRPRWLRRVRNTPKQTAQTAAGRRDNVRGAFRTRGKLDARGKTCLLVDDVLTTGSTCSEAARVLRDAGAARILVAVLAVSHP